MVEVVSLSDTNKASRQCDYVEKRAEYAERGIPECWIIDPRAAVVFVLTLVSGDYQEQQFTNSQQLISSTFPQFELSAATVLTAGL